jgi:hypothetical protein
MEGASADARKYHGWMDGLDCFKKSSIWLCRWLSLPKVLELRYCFFENHQEIYESNTTNRKNKHFWKSISLLDLVLFLMDGQMEQLQNTL